MRIYGTVPEGTEDLYQAGSPHAAGEQIRITNRAFVATNDYSLGSEISINSVDRWSELMPEAVMEGADRLLFGYFKVPLANADDTGSPLEYLYIPEQWN